MNESHATIIGNLTADLTLAFTPDARAVLNATVASTRRWQQQGQWNEHTSFHRIVAFGQLAENMAASFRKGDRIIVVGRLETSTWETKTGDKRTDVQLVVEHCGPSVQFATVDITRTVGEARAQHPAARTLRAVSDEEPF